MKMELDAHDLFIAMAIMTRIIRSEYTPREIWAAVDSIIYLYHVNTINSIKEHGRGKARTSVLNVENRIETKNVCMWELAH